MGSKKATHSMISDLPAPSTHSFHPKQHGSVKHPDGKDATSSPAASVVARVLADAPEDDADKFPTNAATATSDGADDTDADAADAANGVDNSGASIRIPPPPPPRSSKPHLPRNETANHSLARTIAIVVTVPS